MAKITVVDAVMGTGKSFWAIDRINNSNDRTIVVLPYLTELNRYEEGIVDKTVVSLGEKMNGKNKQMLFRQAIMDADVILITHSLFTEYLKMDVFTPLSEGEWHLLIDEALPVFEPVKGISTTMVAGWMTKGFAIQKELDSGVIQVIPEPLGLVVSSEPTNTILTRTEKLILTKAAVSDLLYMHSDGGGFYSFALAEFRLKAFRTVTVLTYMFKNSDMEYWCRSKGIKIEHVLLVRNEDNSFTLSDHPLTYSGAQFRDLIEILDSNSAYGNKHGHFSVSGSKGIKSGNVLEVRKDLKRLFRNKKLGIMVDDDDFMFTCLSDSVNIWYGPNLPKKFIGPNTWVAFNTRGVNNHAHKHNLAFLFNAFQHPSVERMINSSLNDGEIYDRNTFALSILIQWIWRSAIRNGEKIRLYIPSKRMRELLEDWLAK